MLLEFQSIGILNVSEKRDIGFKSFMPIICVSPFMIGHSLDQNLVSITGRVGVDTRFNIAFIAGIK